MGKRTVISELDIRQGQHFISASKAINFPESYRRGLLWHSAFSETHEHRFGSMSNMMWENTKPEHLVSQIYSQKNCREERKGKVI